LSYGRVEAISYFEKVDAKSDLHAAAVTNKSICELYRCSNESAVQNLQRHLNAQPIEHLQEPLVRTLYTLYDLKGGYLGAEYVQKLKNWISELIPDDFAIQRD